jgi:hypothetical protein
LVSFGAVAVVLFMGAFSFAPSPQGVHHYGLRPISWMRELARVFDNPRRTIDPVNYELALNWLREKYNEQTEKELSESIFKKILRWLTPAAIKKRRERLGLTSKRPPGPRPNSDR